MKAFLDWLDHRTGYRKLTDETLNENVPGGSRWRYIWGSALVFTFFLQIVTGLFLWMAYSPNSHSAWESVYYIQFEMTGGWLLRGIHHYAAQVMNVLLILHLAQVIIDGAYKAPREMNYWFGLLLLQLTLAISLTGYLLPWDQKGFWATQVATNLASIVPIVGPSLQQLIIGGTEYGHHTLTRFFALHAGILPGLMILLTVGHIYLFRRHGLTPAQPKRRPDQKFWPEQVLKDSIGCFGVMMAVLFLVCGPYVMGWSNHLGAGLTAPADPSSSYGAARPEWYFLFLFQFLKYFPGWTEIIGAIIIPSIGLLILFLMPFIAKWPRGHVFNVGYFLICFAGAAGLTYQAMEEDKNSPEFAKSVAAAEASMERVLELSEQKFPEAGALALLRKDSKTQGPKLFAQHCASCHRYNGHNGMGVLPTDEPTASDLKGFATREWMMGWVDYDRITSIHYFGGTEFVDGKMAKFVKRKISRFDDEELELLKKAIFALSAEAQLPTQAEIEKEEADLIQEGFVALQEEVGCTDCHRFHNEDEDADAPLLTGYGSKEWLTRFIKNPEHPDFYGEDNDRMPKYGEGGKISEADLELLVDWLRQDWYRSEKHQDENKDLEEGPTPVVSISDETSETPAATDGEPSNQEAEDNADAEPVEASEAASESEV